MSATDCSPLHAAYYADQAEFVSAKILQNELMAEGTYRLRFEAPTIAQRITPGQFVMIRLAGFDDPMLGRAFALYDVATDADEKSDKGSDKNAVDIVYMVHGKMTTALASRQPGDLAEVWGPLGNGFTASSLEPNKGVALQELLLVAGGIGQTPFLATGKEALGKANYGADPAAGQGGPHRVPLKADKVTLCYGVRNEKYLAGVEDFRSAGIELRLASDDGSVGHHGLVTDLLKEEIERTEGKSRLVLCCGPEPMMQAVAELCLSLDVPCQVSLETPMACGIGICFSCVAKVVQPDGEWDYKRTCVEGPVFDAKKIVW